MFGQSWNIPLVGELSQSLDPPPQFGIPEEPISDAPIIRITVPAIRGLMQRTQSQD